MDHVKHDGKLVWIPADFLLFGLRHASPDPKAQEQKAKPKQKGKRHAK
jgi:hypothetical protein